MSNDECRPVTVLLQQGQEQVASAAALQQVQVQVEPDRLQLRQVPVRGAASSLCRTVSLGVKGIAEHTAAPSTPDLPRARPRVRPDPKTK